MFSPSLCTTAEQRGRPLILLMNEVQINYSSRITELDFSVGETGD